MSKMPRRVLHIDIPSDPARLGSVRRQVEPFARGAGFDEETSGHIMLALDEALTNVIRHAYNGADDRPIEIDLSSDGPRLSIAVRDYGKTVPVEAIQGRDLEEVRPGGLGVHIITNCMDTVDYTPLPDGGTKLIMTKALPTPGDEGTPDE